MQCSNRSPHSPFPLPHSLLPAFALSLFLISCANPVPPTGGPQDTTPPSVVASTPEDGTVNVDRDISVEIAFSEYIDRGSVEQALSVTPALDAPLDVDIGGRSVTVHFPEPLRDSTTYILTLDTNLRDTRNVELDAPITLAFSTGPTINRGQMSGRVVQPDAGDPQEGIDVYAYLVTDSTADGRPILPDSLPARPDYRTQTGSDGQFQFDYLREDPYYVVALMDNNRDRQPDPQEAYAPPPVPVLVADSTGATAPAPWVATLRDTLPPQTVRVQSRSQSRHAVRFDARVQLLNRSPDRWQLQDSVQATAVPVETVYQHGRDRRLVVLRTDALNSTPHRLIIPDSTVADSSGNAARPDTLRFNPAEDPDTLQTRFVEFLPTDLSPDSLDTYTLLPGEAPGVRFNEPVDSTDLATLITARDSTRARRSFTLATDDGTTYQLHPDAPLRATERLDVTVGGPPLAQIDTTFTRRFRRISNRQLGALSGTVLRDDAAPDTVAADSLVADSPDAGPSAAMPLSNAASIVVELIPEDPSDRVAPRSAVADSTGTFRFERLPEGSYRFRAFLDLNGNGVWDGGQLLPYTPAEPITWSEGTIDNRPRWDNVLESPLRLPPAPAQ